MSINIEYTNKEINELIISNVLKMLERRGLINSWIDNIKKINTDWTNNIYEILLLDKSIYSIYLLNNTNNQLTTISHGVPLDDYLSNNLDIKKIVIVRSISKKAVKQILYDYKNTEFFFENEMLEDIPSKIFIPKHILLTKEEKKELAEVFDEKDIGKILLFDIMTRYYNANVGDIFRIIRPSLTAGYNIYYRKVINSTIDIIF